MHGTHKTGREQANHETTTPCSPQRHGVFSGIPGDAPSAPDKDPDARYGTTDCTRTHAAGDKAAFVFEASGVRLLENHRKLHIRREKRDTGDPNADCRHAQRSTRVRAKPGKKKVHGTGR